MKHKIFITVIAFILSFLNATIVFADDCEHLNAVLEVKDGEIMMHCTACNTYFYASTWNPKKDESGITMVTPYLDNEADQCDIGRQRTYLTSQNKMYEIWLLSDEGNMLMAHSDLSSSPQSGIQIELPYCEVKTSATFIVQYQKIAWGKDNKMDTTMVYSPLHFTIKPFHAIHELSVTEIANPDSTGLKHPYNLIKFAIINPDDEDILNSDQLLIYRSKYSDFSEYENIQSYSISSCTSRDTVIIGKTKTIIGWYEYKDEDEDANYNEYNDNDSISTLCAGADSLINNKALSTIDKATLAGFYSHKDRPVYYQVRRAIVGSLWENHRGEFIVEDTVSTSTTLPAVSGITVTQGSNWKKDKKVTLKVKLQNPYPWEYNELSDSILVKNLTKEAGMAYRRYNWDSKAKIKIERYSPSADYNNGKDEVAKTILIDGDDVSWNAQLGCFEAVAEDCQALPYTHYYYKATTDGSPSYFPMTGNNNPAFTSEKEANDSWSKTAALISNFAATQGTLASKVIVHWEIGSGKLDNIILQRRIYDKDAKPDDNWSNADGVNATTTEWTDVYAGPGQAIEYRIISTLRYREKDYQDTLTTIGWSSFYGKIAGKVAMPNGTGIQNAKIVIKRTTPIYIPDVVDENGNVILKGVQEGVEAQAKRAESNDEGSDVKNDTFCFTDTVVTDASGAYSFDSLLYQAGENYTKYTVAIIYGGSQCKFDIFGNQGTSVDIELGQAQPQRTDVDFTCSTYCKFTGRVLYKDSTVPVRGAYFLLSTVEGEAGKPVCNQHGEKIVTDIDGNFSFVVPMTSITIQVAKDKHVFLDDGYLSVNGKKYFTPNGDKNFPTVYDTTKVRIVGRICGGNVQANLPLGFGLSKNNLGDNLTMVLQLEGDNSAQIVYNLDDPDNTEVDTTFVHPYAGIHAPAQTMTKVSYQRKRIIITPDPLSGEFFVDLYPTKYKVSQLSASGYSTLYAKGEGFDIIDFSESVEPLTMICEQDAQKTFEYEGAYVKVYHNAATVTYNQFRYGQKTGYLGEESITEMNLAGEDKTAVVATYDKATGMVDYLFGYPVFVTGNKYTLQVSAHEDYYYNNDETTGALDEVPLESGILYIQNGLLDNNKRDSVEIDSMGLATIVFEAGNSTFKLTGEDALRSLNLSVKLNGYYYEAIPIRGFVTGYRDMNTNTLTSYDSDITVLDILRDPYGANSSSWMESGATYTWTRSLSAGASINLGVMLGQGISASEFVGAWAGVGTMVGPMSGFDMGTTYSTSALYSVNFTIPITDVHRYINANYTITTSQKISTSSDPLDVGAMADVYIGTVHTTGVDVAETFSVIDSITYVAVQKAIASGAVHVVKEGIDAQGKQFYLVIGEKLHVIQDNGLRTFAYSQKYIIGTLIPNLIDARDSKLLSGISREEAKKMANDSQEVKYWSSLDKDDSKFGLENTYEMIIPEEVPSGFKATNEVALYNQMLIKWIEVIIANEKTKVDNMSSSNVTRYSIAGTSVDYSETFSAYYRDAISGNILGAQLGKNGRGAWAGTVGVGGKASVNTDNYKQGEKYANKVDNAIIDAQEASKGLSNNTDIVTIVPGLQFKWNVTPDVSIGVTNTQSGTKVSNTSRGFSISTADNSYFDIDVVKVYAQKADSAYLDWNDDKMGWTSFWGKYKAGGTSSDDVRVSDFLFYLRGGATRNPYIDADSTLFYNGDTPLGSCTLKIDNPKIYIDRPIVNNMPEDEKATFKITLSNESELNDNVSLLNPTTLTLLVDDASNPNGAKLTMDGQPLTSGRLFCINPGESITKTLEVARGSGYDFENIKLLFVDTYWSSISEANISVHYLPVACNVNVASPTDKWVMNTNSATDADGRYYIPITIDQFNVNSEDFHHIELQYKKQTEGDSQWTTVCGFYNDSTLFVNATGKKEMIPASGKITNVAFYGEKNEEEMEYDLRAVSFRALGTGFVTRASNVISGTKDTRCPEVFGKPKPANGILTFQDVISIPFNEPIAYNYLDKTSNFQILGYTNESDNTVSSSIYFPKTTYRTDIDYSDSCACSKVYRNLSNLDFTIDAKVQLMQQEPEQHYGAFFSIIDSIKTSHDHFMSFGINGNRLYAIIGENGYYSEPISQFKDVNIYNDMQNVSMTFTQPENTPQTQKQVHFYYANKEVAVDESLSMMALKNQVKCDAYGKLYLGYGLSDAKVSDIRLWSKALELGELSNKSGKILSSAEPGLIGYWPMVETTGKIVHDRANSADIYLTKQQWSRATNHHSAHLDATPLVFDNATSFDSPSYADFTLGFWIQQENSTDSCTLFTAGDKGMSTYFRIAMEGESIKICSADTTFTFSGGKKIADGDWHNIAFIANKSYNTATFYIDGQLFGSLAGTDIAGMSNTNVRFGDNKFVGNLDNVTFWHLALPDNSMSQLYIASPSGYEMGLEYFIPFEKEKLNSLGRYDNVFSNENYVFNRSTYDNSKWIQLDDKVFKLTADLERTLDNSTSCSPTVAVRELTPFNFNFTSTDNELQINILEQDSKINLQNILVIVRGVEDLAGNTMKNPQTMRIFVKKNLITWDQPSLTINVPYGQECNFTTSWTNASGTSLSYYIEKYNTWLHLSKSSGIANPISSQDVTFTIDAGIAPGQYNTTVYLTDDSQLSSPLELNINVVADEPTWNVTTDQSYNQSMNITSQVYLTSDYGIRYLDKDKRDLVGVFYNGVCLGRSYITVEEGGAPYVYLTVKGMNDMNAQNARVKGKILDFRLWQASTGNISKLDCIEDTINHLTPVRFAKNTSVGTHSLPIGLITTDTKNQQINLEKGWNWVSLYVQPSVNEGVNGLFEDNSIFTQNDRMTCFESSCLALYNSSKNMWEGNMDGVPTGTNRVYEIYVQNPCIATVLGKAYTDDNRKVTFNTVGWNAMAYLYDVAKPINDALSGYLSDGKLVDGTIIKAHDSFAVADQGGWYGSLQYLQPGQGYYIYHKGATPCTIEFFDETMVLGVNTQNIVRPKVSDACAEHVAAMPVIATFADDVTVENGDELVAYSGDEEVVGRASMQTSPEGNRFFITVNAESGAPIRFAQVRDGETIATTQSYVRFSTTGIAGTLAAPYVVDFNSNDDDVIYYTTDGIRIENPDTKHKQVMVGNNGKKLIRK